MSSSGNSYLFLIVIPELTAASCFLLENDHERLSELATIFHDTRFTPNTAVHSVAPVARPPRSAARPRTSPPSHSFAASHALVRGGDRPSNRPMSMSASVGGVPRRSAAFLELSDSESDSSDADELLDGDDLTYYSTSLPQRRPDSNDRSISKLSNFFGSTPSQIVRSQSGIRAASSSADSFSDVNKAGISSTGLRGKVSRPDALKTILRSLEEEALDDSKLTSFQKSEISRKVHLLKKRTTKMFA